VGTVDAWLVALIVVLIVLCAFLALAETALTRMNHIKALALEEQERKHAKVLRKLVEHPERTLNPILLLILVCSLVAATLIGVLADKYFGAAGVLIATIIEVVVIFVFAEAAPKTWAIQHSERAALLVAPMVNFIVSIPPLRWITRGLIGMSNAILPGKGLPSPFVSEEELLAAADAAVEGGEIEREERALIHSIIEFGDTVVREVMVPRPDMVSLEADATIEAALELAMRKGLSRMPVTGETVDDIVGICYLKDLLRAVRENKESDRVRSRVRKAHFVPETKAVSDLMREMQEKKHHMSIVVDEYGSTVGLVTLEDLIEELVGEIVDEFDREEPSVKKLPNGDFLVTARIPLDEVSELLGVELPEGDWDTISGYIFTQLGHVPQEGESIRFDGYEFFADKVQGRRITRVRISPVREHEERAV
jgi:putative hemolysin